MSPDPEALKRYHQLRQDDPYRARRFRYALDNDPGPEGEPPEWARPEREPVTPTRSRNASVRSEEP